MIKKVTYFITLLICAFTAFDMVYASDYSDTLEAVNRGEAYLLCDYANTIDEDAVRVYAYPVNSTSTSRQYIEWRVFYKTSKEDFKLIGDLTRGSFSHVFTNGRIYLNSYKNYFSSESTFSCTDFAYIDLDGNKELCFTDKSDSCGYEDKFDRNKVTLVLNSDSLFTKADNYAINLIKNMSYEHFLNDAGASVKIDTKKYMKETYFSGNYKYPDFLDSYINNLDSNVTSAYNAAVSAKTSEVEEKAREKFENGEITEEEYYKIVGNTQNFESSYTKKSTSVETSDLKQCTDLLPAAVQQMLQNVLDLVKYGGPILVAIFTIIDLIKASLSGEKDDMKKATNKFGKRLVAAILLFFIPLIVDLIFKFVGISGNCSFR